MLITGSSHFVGLGSSSRLGVHTVGGSEIQLWRSTVEGQVGHIYRYLQGFDDHPGWLGRGFSEPSTVLMNLNLNLKGWAESLWVEIQ